MTQRPPRREPEIPEAAVALDERSSALSQLLPEALAAVETDIGAAVDEVTVTVSPADISTVCRTAKEDPRLDFDYVRCLCVVDYGERLEVNYHLLSLGKRHKMVIKTFVDPDDAHLPSVTSVWRGVNWFEREAHDLFGVTFDGHPNLVPLLLYEGFEGFPGRKSFPFHDYDEW